MRRACLSAVLLSLLLPTRAVWGGEYKLVIERQTVNITGKPKTKITVNGQIPGPLLRFREGEQVVVNVTNRLDEITSVHWHGLILPGSVDGVPGFNGFKGIAPGETYTYRFPAVQSGTYWYHAHSATQEQDGHYGPLIIDPATPSAVRADREHLVVLSEYTEEDPEAILNNLKGDPGYYNFAKRTVPDFFRDAKKFGLPKTLKDRSTWGKMRMDPTDIADVGNYTLLVNGKPPAKNETLLFKLGERVKLRFINASAMTYMDVRVPGLKMTIVAADGRDVEPVEVDEFRMAVAETYDVIVEPEREQAFTVFAESIDRQAYARATLAPRLGMTADIPKFRPRAILTTAEMGHNMERMGDGAIDHVAMGHVGTAPASAPPGAADHAAMGHSPAAAAGAPGGDDRAAAGPAAGSNQGPMPGMEHTAMDAPRPATPASPDHAAMGHAQLAPAGAGSMEGMDRPAMPGMPRSAGAPADPVRVGTAVQASTTPLPAVDYGMGTAMKMDGMDHGDMAGMDMEGLGQPGEFDGSGRVFGWSSGAPYGAKVLSYADLRSARPQADTRPPQREVVVRLSGNMERYIWTLNGKKFGEAEPIRLNYGERVKLTFINETMMAHPMHLHGMFTQLDNGQPLDRVPDKSVVSVAPGKTYSALITADAPGEWAFHCHLLYHMESGMMQKVVVARLDGQPAPPAPARDRPRVDPHAGHGGQ